MVGADLRRRAGIINQGRHGLTERVRADGGNAEFVACRAPLPGEVLGVAQGAGWSKRRSLAAPDERPLAAFNQRRDSYPSPRGVIPASRRSEWVSAVMKPASRWPMLETMNTAIRHIAPWSAAAAISGALIFAPVAGADSSADPDPHAAPSASQSQAAPVQSGADPLVPYGTDFATDEPDNPYISPTSGG